MLFVLAICQLKSPTISGQKQNSKTYLHRATGVRNGWCLGCHKKTSLRVDTVPELEDGIHIVPMHICCLVHWFFSICLGKLHQITIIPKLKLDLLYITGLWRDSHCKHHLRWQTGGSLVVYNLPKWRELRAAAATNKPPATWWASGIMDNGTQNSNCTWYGMWLESGRSQALGTWDSDAPQDSHAASAGLLPMPLPGNFLRHSGILHFPRVIQ